ncbi:MAG: acyloxyacyl hydrolase [Paracoccaceae bacterium]
MKLLFAASIAAVILPVALHAQEFALGVGTTDYGDTGTDGGVFALDYRHKPFRENRISSFAVGGAISLSEEGDFFVGAGLSTRWQWDSGWFVESSVMPGLYEEGTAGNDLGSAFEIRSLFGVGYKFKNGHAVSAAISHKSNASLATDNPGMNAYTIRYHFPF